MSETEQLILDHIRLAEQLAARFCKQFKIPSSAREEMRSAAFVGLCRAAGKFDQARGVKFETFSFNWIRGAMFDQVRREMKHQSFDNVVGFRYFEDRGIEVHRSFDADTGSPVIDLSVSGDDADDAVMAADVRQLVEQLPGSERDVLRLHYFEEATLSEIRDRLGIDKFRVWRLRKAGEHRLRRRWSLRAVKRITEVVEQRRPVSLSPEPRISRSDLLALRARLEQRYQESLRDIDAAIRLFDSGIFGAPAPVSRPQQHSPSPVPEARARKPKDSSLVARFEQALSRSPKRFTTKELVSIVEAGLNREISPGSVPFCFERLLMSGKIVVIQRGSRGRANVYERVDSVEEASDAEQDEAA